MSMTPKIVKWYSKNRSSFKTSEEAAKAYSRISRQSYLTCLRTIKEMGEEKISLISSSIKHTLSEKELKAMHDPFYKIEQAAKSLKDGEYVLDSDFREHFAKLSTTAFRRPSDNAIFIKYKGKAGEKIYWGSPKSIEKMKTEGVLS